MSQSNRSITVKAPAKLNLYLDVIGRRADGYHDIISVMQTVSLYNTVCAALCDEPGIALATNRPDLPTDRRNTAYRAAETFAAMAGIEPAIDLILTKEVPYGAGMGSASADAAGVLVALNALYGGPLDMNALLEAGRQVGADVPFLLQGGTMLCEGIGDEMTALPHLDELYFLIAKGGESFSTADIYARFDRQEPPGIFLVDGLRKALEEGRPGRVAKHLANRFEYCLFDTPIAEYKALLLRCGAKGAAMTGTGSAVFGAFTSEPQAHAAAAQFREEAKKHFGEEPYVAVARPVQGGPVILDA